MHNVKNSMETLKELEDTVEGGDIHGDRKHYVDSKIREAKHYISDMDNYHIHGANSILKDLSDNILRGPVDETDEEYILEECVEARLVIEGVMIEWENELSEQ